MTGLKEIQALLPRIQLEAMTKNNRYEQRLLNVLRRLLPSGDEIGYRKLRVTLNKILAKIKKDKRDGFARVFESTLKKRKEKADLLIPLPLCQCCLKEMTEGSKIHCVKCKENHGHLISKYNGLKGRARIKGGIIFNITLQEYMHLFTGLCRYCKCELNPNGAYSDRSDRDIGYVEGNVEITCRDCFRIKSNGLTKEEMLAVAKLLSSMRLA